MLLTIAIPTYDRAEYLISTLQKLIEQVAEQFVGQIEILVSDNASTDCTETICHEFKFNNPRVFRYMRQTANQGFDRNLESLFVNALGTYVLLIGDDDYPLPGTLEKICNNLLHNKGAPAGVYYSYHDLIDGDTGKRRTLEEDFFRVHSAGSDEEVTRYASGIELLRCVATPLYGGLTGTIFLRAAWLKAQRKTFFGTNFLHLAVAYQVAAERPVYIDHRALFAVRTFRNHRWPINGALYFGLLKAGQPLYGLYPTDIVNLLRRRNDWAVRRAIILYRAAAPMDNQLIDVIRGSIDKNRFAFWLIDTPLLLIPGHIFTLLVKLAALAKIEILQASIKRIINCKKN